MKVCITGSAGFIGRHLVAAYEARGALVTGVDIAEQCDCRHFFAQDDSQFDLAIHCAAQTGGIIGTTENAAVLSARNSQMDGAFFEWALRTHPRRIVYFSSSCAYPLLPSDDDTTLLKESDIDLENFVGRSDNTYGWVKLLGEVIANSVRDTGIPTSIVRPFAVYGSDQENCRMIPKFIERALRTYDNLFEVWGRGYQASDFLHIDDCVNALLAMVDNDIDGPLNLGTGRGVTVDEAAEMVMKAARVKRSIVHNLDKPSGPRWRVADPTLLKTFYKPQISLEEGIHRALVWHGVVPTSYGPGDDLAS